MGFLGMKNYTIKRYRSVHCFLSMSCLPNFPFCPAVPFVEITPLLFLVVIHP